MINQLAESDCYIFNCKLINLIMCFLIALFLFSIFCFSIGYYTAGIISLLPLIGGTIILIIASSKEKKKQAEEEEEARKQERIRLEELEIKKPIYIQAKENLIRKYGNPDREIILEDVNLDREILVFGNSNRIWLLGKDLLMSDIISCDVNDEAMIIKGQIVSSTKTNTGSAVQRAAVGGLLLGGVGAIIGGNTAKKETITQVDNDKLIHNYTILININNLSTPIIKINLGQDDETVNNIMGLMNVIVNRNSTKH